MFVIWSEWIKVLFFVNWFDGPEKDRFKFFTM